MYAKTRHCTEAIVLRSYPYGEYDRIVRFFTREFGKLAGIAKGAKNSRRRFPGTLEPWCLSRLDFSQTVPERLAFLEHCEPMDYFSGIRADPVKNVYAACLGEMVEAFSPDRKRHETLFDTFRYFLVLVDRGNITASVLSCFQIRILALVGYAPALERCVSCRRSIDEGGNFFFVPEVGGIKCEPCLTGRDRARIDLTMGTMKSLHLAMSLPVEKLERIHLSPVSCREGKLLLEHFITHLLGKHLQTTKVLAQMETIS